MKRLILTTLSLYKWFISPTLGTVLGGACRFHPTCSHYSHQAIKRFGLLPGAVLSIKRFLRCTPLSKSDYYDPVPVNFKIKWL